MILSTRNNANPFRCVICQVVRPRVHPIQVCCTTLDSPTCRTELEKRRRAENNKRVLEERRLRPRKSHANPYASLAPEIIRLYDQEGLSAGAVARMLGGGGTLSDSTVIKILRQHGVKIRAATH